MSIYRMLPLEDIDLLRQAQNCRLKNAHESCLMLGENTQIRRSLLFQAALSIASKGEQVIFICPKPFPSCPYSICGMTEPSHPVLHSIKMIYISKLLDLYKYFCEFHTTSSLPSAIFVDELEHYVAHRDNREYILVVLIAILEDTVGYIQQKKGEACCRFMSLNRRICWADRVKSYFREIWEITGNANSTILLTDDHVNHNPAFQVKLELSSDDKMVVKKVERLTKEVDA